MLAALCIGVLLGSVLLIAVCCLPYEPIRKNIAGSAEYLYSEGRYLYLISGYECTELDSYTDALMLLCAYGDPVESGIAESAMNVPYIETGDSDPYDSFIKYFYYNDRSDVKIENYYRYWHGYLVLLKPLSMVFQYNTIMLLNASAQLFLIVLCAHLIGRKIALKYEIAFIIAVISLAPIATMLSMQYSAVLYITLISCCILLLKKEMISKESALPLYFLSIGMAVSYFDLLTYPVLSLGMPLVLVMLCTEGRALGKQFKTFFSCSVSWLIGYIVMWVSKWIVGSILTGDNLVFSAIEQVRYRLSGDVGELYNVLNRFDAVAVNIMAFPRLPIIIALVLSLLTIAVLFYKKKVSLDPAKLMSLAPILFICALLPFVWYVFVLNHSYIHRWFTYRALAVAVFSFFCMLFSSVRKTDGSLQP